MWPLSILIVFYDVAKAALVIRKILITRRAHMSKYIQDITVSLQKIISDLSENPSLFLRNPEVDFSRNRKIDFKTFVGITLNSGGCTMKIIQFLFILLLF